MTENEAIKVLNKENCYECTCGATSAIACNNEKCKVALATRVAVQALGKVQEYWAIGTVDEFKALKEKSIAEKAEWKFDDFTAKFGKPYRCSNCDEEFEDTYNYCPNCGCDMYAD